MSLITCSAGALSGSDFRLIVRSLAVTMNQKSSLPQLSRLVSRVLTADNWAKTKHGVSARTPQDVNCGAPTSHHTTARAA